MKSENSFVSPKSEIAIKERDLPINNDKIERLKSLNSKYFYGKGEYFDGFGKCHMNTLEHIDDGYECRCDVKSEHTGEIRSFSFWENDSEEEIKTTIHELETY